jgi:hypothetical protein
MINVGVAPNRVFEVALLLKPAQQRLNRGETDLSFSGEGVIDLLDRGLLKLPDDSEDFGFGSAQGNEFLPGHLNLSIHLYNTNVLYKISRTLQSVNRNLRFFEKIFEMGVFGPKTREKSKTNVPQPR